MTTYIRDEDGRQRPLTGHWCLICAWPLTPVRAGQDRHLDCAVDVDDVGTRVSGLEQTLHADLRRQCHADEAPPGHRVWAQMPQIDEGSCRLDYIYVFDEDFLLGPPEDPCSVCHLTRRDRRHGGYGLFILDAAPDPWVFCPGCSIACFCPVCGHQTKPTDRRSDEHFPDLCLEHAGQLSYITV